MYAYTYALVRTHTHAMLPVQTVQGTTEPQNVKKVHFEFCFESAVEALRRLASHFLEFRQQWTIDVLKPETQSANLFQDFYTSCQCYVTIHMCKYK